SAWNEEVAAVAVLDLDDVTRHAEFVDGCSQYELHRCTLSFVSRGARSMSTGRGGVRQQRHLASVLDGDGDATLFLNRESGHPTRPDLAPLGDELPERCNVLVVNVLASAQRIGLLLGLALCCRGRGHCGALLSSPARHLQPIAGMCLGVGVKLSDQNG